MATGTTVQVTLPQMGESVTEGDVLAWHKHEGDHVEADEIIVEISTDKVDAEVPAPASGTLVKIFAAEGETVRAGSVIAEIAVGDGAAPPAAGNGGAPAEAAEEQPEAADEQAATGEIVDIVTPTGGESVTEGEILEWAVKVGDSVDEGQTVVDIATDKVDMELPAPAAGTIVEILAQDGETVTVGQTIARLRTGAAAARPAAEGPSGNGAATAAPAAAPEVPEDARVSPVAARAAAAEGVDLATVTGTGPNGRITKADVLGAKNGAPAAAPAPAAPAPAAAATVQPIRGGAATLARYMDESR
ncbi:MAG TPA: biotin/lipoyl-containing protein, partial [Solirubrobacteraceae bacterium]|nr:biotin/lipoyl-containing protein [Solirubrobacteraceae bacterium]